jgi:hypothetical protein
MINPRSDTDGSDERATKVSDHGPIEREYSHAEAAECAEKLVGDDILWSNPADPVKHAESGKEIAGKPVPKETAGKGDAKELFTGHVTTLLFAVITVEGIEKGSVDESARPDHARRPNDKLAQEAAEGEADHLGGKYEEH